MMHFVFDRAGVGTSTCITVILILAGMVLVLILDPRLYSSTIRYSQRAK